MKVLEDTVKWLDAACKRAQKLSPTSAVLEQVLQVRVVDISIASQRQVPMLQTSAAQRMSGGHIRDHRAAVLHDPEGPERKTSSTDADHRQDDSQLVQELLEVSKDSLSTGTSMLSWSCSDKFLRSKQLGSSAR